MSTFLVECDRATWQRYGFADKTHRAIAGDLRAGVRRHARRPSAGLEQIGVAQFPVDLERALVVQEHGADRRRPAFGAFLDRLGHAAGDRGRDRAGQGAGGGDRYCRRRSQRYQAERKPIVQKLVTAARTSADWYEKFPEHMRLGLMDFAYSYITRSGRIDDARLRAMSPAFMARYEASTRQSGPAMSPTQDDRRPGAARQPRRARDRLCDPATLQRQPHPVRQSGERPRRPARADRPAGTRSYAELCAEASRWGHGFVSLGLKRGDRILMFLDDTPAYPAAFFGAVRAGFVPLLINTLTPPDLLQFYLVGFRRRGCRRRRRVLRALRCRRPARIRALRTLIVGQRRGRRSRRAERHRRRALAAGVSRRARGSRHRPQRDGVLDVFVGLDRTAQGHRPSAARHGLQRCRVRAQCAEAEARRHLLFGAENLLRLWLRQFHHLPVLGGRGDAAAAGPAEAGGDFRGDRALSPHRVLRLADALHLADQGRRRRGHAISRRCAWRCPPPRCCRPRSSTAGRR